MAKHLAGGLLATDPSATGCRRGRLVLVSSAVLIGSGVLLALAYRAAGDNVVASKLFLATALGLLMPLLLRASGSPAVTGAVLVVSVSALVTSLAAHKGSLSAPCVIWYALLPLLAVLTSGPRMGAACTVLVLVEMLAVYGAYAAGLLPAPQPTPEFLKLCHLLLMGAATGLLALLLDGLRQEAAETARVRLRLAAVAESVVEAVVCLDLDGRVVYWNPAAAEMFGYTAEEALGQSFHRFVPPELAESQEAMFRQLLQGQSVRADTIERVRRDGSRVFVSVSAYPLKEEAQIVGTVAVSRDISARLEFERNLQDSRDRLRNLTERLLRAREEERRLVAADLHDGLLQSVVAADMQLRAYTRRRGSEPGIEPVQRALSSLDTAISEGRRLISLLRPAVLEDFGLVEAIRQDLDRLAQREGIQVEFEERVAGKCPEPLETSLYRAFQEAVHNAVKHSGTDWIRVVLQEVPGALRLEVADRGRGFTAGSREHSGFGLSLIQERAALLGGECTIDSRPGEGTRITFVLPLEVSSANLPEKR